MLEVAILSLGAILLIELWRRHVVRTRDVPRWVSPVLWGCMTLSLAGNLFGFLMLVRAAATSSESGNKATDLAEGVSYALNANAVAVVAIALAGILLGVVMLVRSRR